MNETLNNFPNRTLCYLHKYYISEAPLHFFSSCSDFSLLGDVVQLYYQTGALGFFLVTWDFYRSFCFYYSMEELLCTLVDTDLFCKSFITVFTKSLILSLSRKRRGLK